MKPIVFAGPSIFGITAAETAHVELRSPAVGGDVLKAVQEGVKVIGIIDGLFGQAPAVQHKEILYALSSGVIVLGAASIGALRAAECDVFGMIGVGEIYNSYQFGQRSSDADVAILHAPGELGFEPLTLALVDLEATLTQLTLSQKISPTEINFILLSAQDLHFADRTLHAIADHRLASHLDWKRLLPMMIQFAFSQKQSDAKALLKLLHNPQNLVSIKNPIRADKFSNTIFLQRQLLLLPR